MIPTAGELMFPWKLGRIWSDGQDYPSKFANDTERPRHPLSFGRHHVTVHEFSVFNGSPVPDGEENLPVAGVSWEDAVDYCNWISDRTVHYYLLPLEAEWEYACAAGSRNPFPCGDTITPSDANYYYDEQGNRVEPGCRTAVGSYHANAFGLYDMAGNVCEWVSDSWHPTLERAPVEGESWESGRQSALRVLREGAWDYLPRLLRNSWRDLLGQTIRRDNVGFHVSCAVLGKR